MPSVDMEAIEVFSTRYVDAHIHLADSSYFDQVDAIVDDAVKNGVTYMLSNGMDYDSSIRTINLAKLYESRVIAGVGVHPWTATNANQSLNLEIFEKIVEDNKHYVRAIGEIGLDGKYTQDAEKKRCQLEVFQFFLALAERYSLPVVIHSRLALDDVLAILPSFKLQKILLHWYSGPSEKLRKIKDQGYMISVGPSILYSKRSAEIADAADLSILLTETDGPVNYYGPFEGKPTRPSFVVDVVEKLSEIKKRKLEEVSDAIWSNFRSLLSIQE
jgi:TatD DNase family protein